MEDSILVSGSIIKWKAKEYLSGLMVVNMRASTKTTRKRAEVFSSGKLHLRYRTFWRWLIFGEIIGLTEENTTGNGWMENNTEEELILPSMARQRREHGVKESALSGFREYFTSLDGSLKPHQITTTLFAEEKYGVKNAHSQTFWRNLLSETLSPLQCELF